MNEQDYGLPEAKRPDAPIIGGDSNIFGIVATASKALKRAGFRTEAG